MARLLLLWLQTNDGKHIEVRPISLTMSFRTALGGFMASNALGYKHVLAAMGSTVSDAMPLMLLRVALDYALPFDVLASNTETFAAMREGSQGNLNSYTIKKF